MTVPEADRVELGDVRKGRERPVAGRPARTVAVDEAEGAFGKR